MNGSGQGHPVKPEPDPRRRTIDPTTIVILGDRSRVVRDYQNLEIGGRV